MRLVASCAAVLALGVAAATAAPLSLGTTVGPQADGSYLTPSNQVLRPHGQQIAFGGRGSASAVRPDGRTAAVLATTTTPAVTIVDLTTSTAIQRTDSELGHGSRGISYSPDGRSLYVSLVEGRVVRFPVKADGTVGVARAFALPAWHGAAEIPAGLAVSPDGRRLYVALSRSNRLGVLDSGTGRLLAAVPVGNAPNDVVLAGRTVVVSNGGGRRARRGDRVNDSDGTPIVADATTGAARTGTVSLVDARTLRPRAELAVGLHPTGLAARGRYAFVANANSDTVSIIDVTRAKVVSGISVRPFAGARFGSSANDVATFGADRLLVTLGRNNAMAVYRWSSPERPPVLEGMVPTGWYPTDVAVDRAHGFIVVTNSKGSGLRAVPTPGSAGLTTSWAQQGSVSVMGLPTPATLAAGWETVAANNAWENASAARAPARPVEPVAIPERVGEPSHIKHVFYVIKENRTYDQILGDDPRGNGDPRYVQFGENVTPNQHLLAKVFPLFDNFYIAGSHSPDAHQWATQAFVTDYSERAHPSYPRGYAFDGGDALAYAPSGFLWDNAVRHGRTVRVYGEFANRTDQHGTRSDVPSLDRLLERRYPRFDMRVKDTERLEILSDALDRDIANNTVPNLSIIQLPLDHTHGTAPGAPSPESDIADNDVALGKFIERLSRSAIWDDSAVFVFEDDAQNGLDHVHGSRTTAFIASPYAKRGHIDSTYYTQINLIRTIEQILGLPPMNQMDLAATPMTTAFTDTPDPTPFIAVPTVAPVVVNPLLGRLTGVERAWAEACEGMDFTIPDAAPEQLLNRAIWYSAKGFDVPYPGDGRVLWPHEVAPE